MDRQFWHLSAAQAAGHVCVLCGAAFDSPPPVRRIEVGRAAGTSDTVYACQEPCAEVIAQQWERLRRSMEEQMGVGNTPPPVPTWLGDDGEFRLVLRGLRLLIGAEAMLTVVEDVDTIRWLLSLTACEAEAVMNRARLVLARSMSDGGQ